MIAIWPMGYKRTLKRALQIYRKIGAVPCPALNGELVHFTRIGFDHIIGGKRKKRSKNEQRRRFRLLEFAERIVKNPQALIRYREQEVKYIENRHGQKNLVTSTGKFWTFTEIIKKTKLKVVVSQVDQKAKQFISIMQ